MKIVSHLDSGYPRYCGQINVTSVGGNDGGTEHLFEVEGGVGWTRVVGWVMEKWEVGQVWVYAQA